jgi:hypothetical protein
MIIINVTEKHIARGICGSPGGCAVALAFRDVVKPGITICTSPLFTSLWDQGTCINIQHPDTVTKFIGRFDAEHPVDPFSFEVEIPEVLRC